MLRSWLFYETPFSNSVLKMFHETVRWSRTRINNNISHVQDFLADYEKYYSKTIKWTVSKVKKKILETDEKKLIAPAGF